MRARLLFLLRISLVLGPSVVAADEGMWTFDNVPADKIRAAHGFAPDAAWLDRVRLSAARVEGCSASFVSAGGLVMTNQHCARGCLADLSTAERDLMAGGFLAARREDELRCPGRHVDQLVEIADVTPAVTAAVAGKDGPAFADALRAVTGRLESGCRAGATTRCDLVSLYRGGVYHLYRYRRWDDVRLVFAPEDAIASFGGELDNYEFPRWNLDVAFLRIHEGDKPARPSHHFAWARTPPREGELIFIAGTPGRTERMLTVAQLELHRDLLLPEQLFLLAEQRGFLLELSRRSPEMRRLAMAKLLGVENQLKRQRGQRRLLVEPAFFAARVAEERRLRERVAADPSMARRFGGAWDAVAAAVAGFRAFRTPYIYLEGAKGFDSKLFQAARSLVRAASEREKPDGERLRELQAANLPLVESELASAAPIHPALEIATLTFSLGKLREELGPDHPLVMKLFARETPAELAARVVDGTRLGSPEARLRVWRGEALADPMLELAALVDPEARAVRRRYEQSYEGVLAKHGDLIARARFEAYGRSIYPDATGTLRLSYGAVRGGTRDGRQLPAATLLGRIFERATGTAPFALPRRWLEARPRLRADLPFNGTGTPDTTGGNSGAPVINRQAEVVGVYFDQNSWGTASAYGYDEEQRRAIFVHAEAILHVLRVVYRAEALARELRP